MFDTITILKIQMAMLKAQMQPHEWKKYKNTLELIDETIGVLEAELDAAEKIKGENDHANSTKNY